jgi:trans-aconitate methyltransferase
MSAHHHGHHGHHDHGPGEKTRIRFDPARASRLDDPERFAYLPPREIVTFIDAPERSVVVDFGTGTGTYALAFAHARPDCTVVGLDVQPEMLEMLRAKPDAALVQCGGAELLASLHGTINSVFAINVLHELEDDHVRALFAALAPDATVTVIDWNPAVERPAGPKAEHLYDAAAAEEFLGKFGFVLKTKKTFPYHYALRGRVRR